MIVPVVGSKDRTIPLMLTVWMLEKSEKTPVPAVLVVVNTLPQALVKFTGKVKLATGGVALTLRVALQAGSRTLFMISRLSL